MHWRNEKFYFTLFLVLILLILIGNILILITYDFPVGSDVNVHLKLAKALLKLEYPQVNTGYLYPPAMHITIALLSLIFFTTPLQIMKFLEILLLPLIYIATFFLTYKKYEDKYAAFLCVFLLGSSPAFWDRASQVIPQAIDFLLFPLAVYFFIEKRENIFIFASVYLIYNHSFYAVLLVFSLFIYSIIYDKERVRAFIKIFLLSMPLFIITMLYLPAILRESGSLQTLQEIAVLKEPLFAIKYLGYPLFFLIFITIIHAKFHELSELEKIAFLWMLCLTPMIIFFPDRFLQYFSQPLAILSAIAVDSIIRSNKKRNAFIFLLFLFALYSNYRFYLALIRNGEVMLPLNTLSPFAI